jgi:hypothetical protein
MFAVPFLPGIPGDAVAAGSRGQFGFGACCFVANNRNAESATSFAKQAYLRFRGLDGIAGQSVKLGRTEFIDGAELIPKDATLAALKRDRIAHCLPGNLASRTWDEASMVSSTSETAPV